MWGGKVIITSQDQCDKKFDEYLSQGYSLLRLSKIYYIPSKHDIIGYFEELPVLPTNNLYYGNDEFIQDISHMTIDNPYKYLKILKY